MMRSYFLHTIALPASPTPDSLLPFSVMALIFFNRIRDSGSWSHIGESMALFVMSSSLFLLSVGMIALGEWLMKKTVETRFEWAVVILERSHGNGRRTGGEGETYYDEWCCKALESGVVLKAAIDEVSCDHIWSISRPPKWLNRSWTSTRSSFEHAYFPGSGSGPKSLE